MREPVLTPPVNECPPGGLVAGKPVPFVTPFASATEAWFWTIRARREGLPAGAGVSRPCDPDHVLRLLRELVRERRVTLAQTRILGRYGELGRQPSAHVAGERADAELWRDALAELAAA